MAQVLIEALNEHHKRSESELLVDVLSPPVCADVWQRMEGVREVMIETFRHGVLDWSKRWIWGRRFAGLYEQAIVLPNSVKSALIPLLAGVPRRTGYTGECRYGILNDRRHLNRVILPRWVDRCFALGFDDGDVPVSVPSPKLTVNVEHVKETLHTLSIQEQWDAGLNIVLCPGAEFGSAKQWPLHHWVTCATYLQQKDFQVWVIGGPKDREDGAWIAQHVPGVHSLCGKTTLGQAIDLLSSSYAVIANDSGLLHVAAACGVPCVGLYGSTPSSYAPPMPRWPGQTHILELEMACRPCRQRVCPLKHRRCLEDILPIQVGQALQTIFENQRVGRRCDELHEC